MDHPQRKPESRPALVFLPGVSGSGDFWSPVARVLGDGWDARFVDWPWAGKPASPQPGGGYDDLVAQVLSALPDRCVLIAQSMGGAVALRVALAAPSKVAGLVLCATSAGIDVTGTGAVDWRPAVRASAPEVPEWVFAPVAPLDDVLGVLTVPTLVICARDDPISPESVAHRLVALIPAATLVLIESDDHWVAQSSAAIVGGAIAKYLAAL